MTKRECLTPETIYTYGLTNPSTLSIHLRFPFEVRDWSDGVSPIIPIEVDESSKSAADQERLRRYDARQAEQQRIIDLIHDQTEAIGADAYRVMRELDKRFGTNHVEEGITKAVRLRDKWPSRPFASIPGRFRVG